jgi:hypothetical protein
MDFQTNVYITGDMDMRIIKICACLGTLMMFPELTGDFTSSYIGVPAPVIVAAIVGTLAGIALGDPIVPRTKLLGSAFAFVFLGAAAASLIPYIIGWRPAPPNVVAGIAVISSASMRWVWPALITAIKPLLDRYLPSSKKE